MTGLVEQMGAAVKQWAVTAHKRHQDGSPDGSMASIGREWCNRFSNEASAMAEGFVNRALSHHNLAFKDSLAKVGIGASLAMDAAPLHQLAPIKLQLTKRLKGAIRSKLTKNTELITSIPSQYISEIEQHVVASISSGRDLKSLTDYLQERMEITKRRASLIARDQNNKATALIHQARQLDLGITKAKWIHTAASIHPRTDTHGAFADGDSEFGDGGPLYDVEVGVDFGDDFGAVIPGQAISCGCLSASWLPGYDDDPENNTDEKEEEPE